MEAKQLSGCTALRHLVVFPLFKQFRANPHLLHLRLGSSRRIFAQPLILLQHNLPQSPPPRSHGEMSTCSVGVEGRPGTHMLCALWPSYIPAQADSGWATRCLEQRDKPTLAVPSPAEGVPGSQP